MEQKKEITVIGLGDMGAMLVRTLLEQGYKVTGWNRSTAKASALVAQGMTLASSVEQAVSASETVMVCVTSYDVSRELLGTPEVTTALSGRTLVQLSSGTPKDARDDEAWANANNIVYLDGAILAVPSQIGRQDALIFVSGSPAAYQASEAPLRALAGGLQFMGEDPGTASTWDMGFLSTLFGSVIGFLHGAKVFQSENIPVAALGNMVLQAAHNLCEMLKNQGDVIQSGNYGNSESSLDICTNGMDLFLRQAQETGINADIPAFIKSIFKRGQDAGYGSEQLAAVFKVL
ncbi:MAG TPA: NAD(P)-binding domain-containing protein [Chitinophaga sp.]|uniref:NAD(P)-dependent oxidoreductase n=1 Tax=Chitinophaga sp. TaxID=1869181 RepID=UPI002C65006F|nr:NAD(P)-binding domain-containing protein [Chitinophaga sp.]HVI45756.1 NAD(P)-binding domain-containing protein [Chitinophaga sp.]